MINSSYGLMLEGTGALVPPKNCSDLDMSYSTLVGCRPYSGQHCEHRFGLDGPVNLHQNLAIALALSQLSPP